MGDGGGGAKDWLKLITAGLIMGGLIASTVDYTFFTAWNNNHKPGFIVLIIFTWIFAIVGWVACYLEQWIVAVVFFLGWTICILVLRKYVPSGTESFIWNSLAACFGVMFAVVAKGGGGGGK